MASKCNGIVKTYTFLSPIGDLIITSCHIGLHSVHQAETITDENFSPNSRENITLISTSEEIYKPVIWCENWLKKYFTNPCIVSLDKFENYPLCFQNNNKGTFFLAVWKTLATKVLVGKTVSYKELAGMCGVPQAARAVGNAMKNNPFQVIVPCHRVIKSDGNTGFYRGGSGNFAKVWLLEHEKVM